MIKYSVFAIIESYYHQEKIKNKIKKFFETNSFIYKLSIIPVMYFINTGFLYTNQFNIKIFSLVNQTYCACRLDFQISNITLNFD